MRCGGALGVSGSPRMGMLFVILFLAASSCSLFSLVRRLLRKRAGARWWIAFGVIGALGIGAGVWCAFYFEYHVGADFRVFSFPLPICFFCLEEGRWVDFPVPRFQGWAAALTNVLTITALATVPLWLVSWRQHPHEKPTA